MATVCDNCFKVISLELRTEPRVSGPESWGIASVRHTAHPGLLHNCDRSCGLAASAARSPDAMMQVFIEARMATGLPSVNCKTWAKDMLVIPLTSAWPGQPKR